MDHITRIQTRCAIREIDNALRAAEGAAECLSEVDSEHLNLVRNIATHAAVALEIVSSEYQAAVNELESKKGPA